MSMFLASADSSNGGGAIVLLLVIFAAAIFVIVGWWKMFEKAGEPGWKAIVPIYNAIVLLRIVGRPWWWILLSLIPIVGFILLIIVYNDLSKSFGKSTGFTFGLVLLHPIFVLILGFGDARYRGPAAIPGAANQPLPPPTA